MRDHESLGRPLLLRNEPTVASRAARGWTRTRSRRRRATPPSSSRPSRTGWATARAAATLRDFLAGVAVGGANASAPPSFVFDEALLAGGGALAADASPDPPLFEIENGGAVLRQLSVGPPKAGAMPHFHGAAYNALQVGSAMGARAAERRRLSRVPALDHFRRLRLAAAASRRRRSGWMRCSGRATLCPSWARDALARRVGGGASSTCKLAHDYVYQNRLYEPGHPSSLLRSSSPCPRSTKSCPCRSSPGPTRRRPAGRSSTSPMLMMAPTEKYTSGGLGGGVAEVNSIVDTWRSRTSWRRGRA